MACGVPYRDRKAQLFTQTPQLLHLSRISRRAENNGEERVKVTIELKIQKDSKGLK